MATANATLMINAFLLIALSIIGFNKNLALNGELLRARYIFLKTM